MEKKKRLNKTSLSGIGFIVLFVLSFWILSCKSKAEDEQFIRLIWIGWTDSVTGYNKGAGIDFYIFYNLNTDSVMIRKHAGTPYAYSPAPPGHKPRPFYRLETFIDHNKSRGLKDTILKALHSLKKYPDGRIDEAFPCEPGDACDGEAVYVEYSYKGKRGNAFFEQHPTDTALNVLPRIYNSFNSGSVYRKKITYTQNNTDSIVVRALQNIGIYDSLPVPDYFP